MLVAEYVLCSSRGNVISKYKKLKQIFGMNNIIAIFSRYNKTMPTV